MMDCHEVKKDVKIVDEIMTFFINRGYHNITIQIDRDKKSSVIIFKLPFGEESKKLFQTMTTEINQHSEVEIEECYWQLLGESDSEYELGLLGSIVDNIEFKHCTNESVIKFIRNHY